MIQPCVADSPRRRKEWDRDPFRRCGGGVCESVPDGRRVLFPCSSLPTEFFGEGLVYIERGFTESLKILLREVGKHSEETGLCLPSLGSEPSNGFAEAFTPPLLREENPVDIFSDSDGFRHRPLPIKADESLRSEERRVGKECRSRWSPYH